MTLRFAKYIEDLKPYIAGKPIEETQREYGVKKVYKLASNENPLGPSPKAIAAIKKSLKKLQLYPDASGFQLRTALARLNQVSFDEVVLGNGSNEIMEFIFKAYGVPGDQMVASRGVFAAFPISARIQGIETIFTPMTEDYRFDLPAMLEQIRKNEKVKFVALPNPNNPTGTYHTEKELLPFLDAVAKIRDGSVHVMLDYAYWEYVTTKEIPNPNSLFKKYSNVSVLRTFSKIYGLGGLRLGYGLLHEDFAKVVQKVRMPFNVSTLALDAGVAAIEDRAFVKKTLADNKRAMKEMAVFFKKYDIPFLPSQGNFYLIETQKAFARSGAEVFQEALKCGLIFRPVTNYGMPDHLRVSMGTAIQNKAAQKFFVSLLKNPVAVKKTPVKKARRS